MTPPLPPRRLNLALLALALGGFALGTGEFVAMGLLPEIAAGIAEPIPTTGHVVSAYALGVVVGAPLIAAVGARLPRRGLLVGLAVVLLLGNLASALVAGYGPLAAARFVSGLPHGAYFGVAALVAASLAGPGRRGWAVARVMLGLTVANVVGVPLATWLGQGLGWRAAFVAVALLAGGTAIAVRAAVPAVAADPGAGVRRELGALRRPQVLLTLGVAALGCGGMFAVYTYIASILTERAGLASALVPVVLVLFGLGMVVGNLVGGRLADRDPHRAVPLALTVNGAVLLLFAVLSTAPVTAGVGAFLIGTSFAIVPVQQTRLMDVAADAQTLAASMNHAAFNLANAIGAWLGGVAIGVGGLVATPLAGTMLSAVGLVIAAVSIAVDRRGGGVAAPDAATSGREPLRAA